MTDTVTIEMPRELAEELASVLEHEVDTAGTVYTTEETMKSGAEAIRGSL